MPEYSVKHSTGVNVKPAPDVTDLRDYFAGQALALGGEWFQHLGNGCDTPDTVSQAAYQVADAMLKARGTGEPQP